MSRKNYFYGERKKKCYFEGWYFKHENGSQTICFIPSFHINPRGEKSAMLQVIANDSCLENSLCTGTVLCGKGTSVLPDRKKCLFGKWDFY